MEIIYAVRCGYSVQQLGYILWKLVSMVFQRFPSSASEDYLIYITDSDSLLKQVTYYGAGEEEQYGVAQWFSKLQNFHGIINPQTEIIAVTHKLSLALKKGKLVLVNCVDVACL